MSGGRRGAYGLAFEGSMLAGMPPGTLVDVGAHVPGVRVDWRAGSDLTPTSMVTLDDDAMTLTVPLAGRLVVGRDDSALYTSAERPAPDLVAHPLLTNVAAARAVWDGRIALHGGTVLVDGAAWSVVGAHGSGKSTLLAGLHHRGLEVLSDDVSMLEGERVWPGPRTLDLRPAAVAHLGDAVTTVEARGETRGRVELAAASVASAPLAGVLVLEPAQTLSVARIAPREALSALAPHVVFGPLVRPGRLLRLARLRVHRVRRPLRWAEFGAVTDAVLRAIGAQSFES